jgi:hypothetical protein
VGNLSLLTKGRIERKVGYSAVTGRLRKRNLGKHVGLADRKRLLRHLSLDRSLDCAVNLLSRRVAKAIKSARRGSRHGETD